MAAKTRIKQSNKRLWLSLAVIVVVLVASFAAYKFYQHNKRVQRTTIPNITSTTQSTGGTTNTSSGKPAPITSGSSASNSTSTSSNATGSNTSSDGSGPQAPYGSFVSSYKPSGGNDVEESVCITTPGASCYIQFIKDGVTKKLETKTVDSSGSAIWDWNIKDAGFTAGSWQVSAVATLNGASKTTQGQTLEVQP